MNAQKEGRKMERRTRELEEGKLDLHEDRDGWESE